MSAQRGDKPARREFLDQIPSTEGRFNKNRVASESGHSGNDKDAAHERARRALVRVPPVSAEITPGRQGQPSHSTSVLFNQDAPDIASYQLG